MQQMSGSAPSLPRSDFFEGCRRAKAGRMGRPCTTIWLSWRPIDRARRAVSSVATKHLSTSLWNHLCRRPQGLCWSGGARAH